MLCFGETVSPQRDGRASVRDGGHPMYPTIPVEVFTGAVELVITLVTVVAVFIGLTIATRG